jgi:hypothetical protein
MHLDSMHATPSPPLWTAPHHIVDLTAGRAMSRSAISYARELSFFRSLGPACGLVR